MANEIEYALMAGASYISTRSDSNKFPVPQGWTENVAKREKQSSGFEATYFAKGTEIVISYAGTDPSDISGDIAANISLASGAVLSDQLKQAADYYLQVKAAAPAGTKITLTGHSLGGGLAALIAVMFGESATTFDQAPFGQSIVLSSVTDIAGQVTATGVAVRLRDYLADRATPGQLAKLDAYIAANDPANPAPVAIDTVAVRSAAVANINVQGEFLSGVPWNILDRIGTTIRNISNSASGVSGDDLHSQALLTAFLYSQQTAAPGHALNTVTFKLPDLLKMVFDKNLFAVDDLKKPAPNLLEHLVRHQAGGVSGVAAGGDKMLTRFTADLDKLTADAGLSVAGSDFTKALIAFAMQAYYSGQRATESDYQLFEKVSGGVHFDRSDIAADLSDVKGYAQYFQSYLATLSETERSLIEQYLPVLQDWYLAGSRLSAAAGDKAAFMFGAADTDRMTGGSQGDLLAGQGGIDSLTGGQGDDILLGGDGADSYVFRSGDGADIIVDTDGGSISRDGAALAAGTQVVTPDLQWRSEDGNTTYTKTGDDLTVTFAGGADGLLIKNFDFTAAQGLGAHSEAQAALQSGAKSFGIRLAPETRLALAESPRLQ